METKIDLNNLENEKIGKIEDRLCDLIDDPGDVFLWTGDSIPTKKLGRFSSVERHHGGVHILLNNFKN